MFAWFLGGLSLHLNHLIGSRVTNYRLAIWDTSFWTFWLKFGHKDLETYPRTFSGHF